QRRQQRRQAIAVSKPAAPRRPPWLFPVATAAVIGVVSFFAFSAFFKPHGPEPGAQNSTPPAPAPPAGASVASASPTSPSASTAPVAVPGSLPGDNNNNVVPGAEPEKLISEYVNRGTELFEQGKFAEAAAAYALAVKASPDDETVNFNLAAALARAG